MKPKSISRSELIYAVTIAMYDYKKTIGPEKYVHKSERVLRAVDLANIVNYLGYFGITKDEIFENKIDLQIFEQCRSIYVAAYTKCTNMKDFNALVMNGILDT